MSATGPAPLESRILGAYRELEDGHGVASLAALRDRLPDVSRQQMDSALLAMDRKRLIQLEPDPNRRAINDRARAAAIRLGREDAHLITVPYKTPGQTAPAEPTTKPTARKATTVATNTAAAGAGSVLVFPPRGLEIKGDVSVNTWCNAGRAQFDGFARWMDSFTTALAADLAEMMRTEGLDGQTTIGPVSWGSSARSAAAKATKPLRAIAAEADNIAKMFTVADRQMHAHVFNVIAEVRAARERQQRGSGLSIGA